MTPKQTRQINIHTNADQLIGDALCGMLAAFLRAGMPLHGISRAVQNAIENVEFWEVLNKANPNPVAEIVPEEIFGDTPCTDPHCKKCGGP